MPNPGARARARRAFAVAVTLLVATALAYNGNVDGNLDTYHEGERLAPLDALRAGKLPFRDVFVQHGLGEDVIKPWLACRLLGDSVESLRRVGSNAYLYRGFLPPLGVAALVLAAAALIHRAGLVLAVAIAASVCFCEATDRHLFGLLALACVGMYVRRRRCSWLIMSGICGALAMLYSLEVGLYATCAILVALAVGGLPAHGASVPFARSAPAPILWFGLGIVICAVPFLVWCASHAITRDFLHNVAIQLFYRRENFGRPYPQPAWIPDAPPWASLYDGAQIALLFYGIPLLYLVAAATLAIRYRRLLPDNRARLALVSVLGVCFWASVWGLPEHWHVAYAVPAFLLFCGVWLDVQWPVLKMRGVLRAGAVAAVLLPILALLAVGEFGALGRRCWGVESWLLPDFLRNREKTLVDSGIDRVGHIRIQRGQAAYLGALMHHIHRLAGPDDTILDLSDQGLLYFLSRRTSPTRFFAAAHCGPSHELQRELIAEVLRHQDLPRCVIRMSDDNPPSDPLHDFVGRFYVRDTQVGRTEVLRRAH